MQEIFEKKPAFQVFICTRSKENSESCGAKGSAALRDELKTWAKEQKLSPHVKITASLCLGYCERGITACFQPTNEWFVGIQTDDIIAFKDRILQSYRDIKT